MTFQLIFDEDSQKDLAEWLSDRTKVKYEIAKYIGFTKDGVLKGCAGYQQFEKCVVGHIALDAPLPKFFLRVIFDYPFNQLKTKKLVCLIEEDNKKSINLCRKLGFRLMHDDKLKIFQMTRPECKWLKE